MNKHQKWLKHRSKVDTDYVDWVTRFIKLGTIPATLLAVLFILDFFLPSKYAEKVKIYSVEERIDNSPRRSWFIHELLGEEQPVRTYMHVVIYDENKPFLNRTSEIELSDSFASELSMGDSLQIFRSRVFEVRKDVAKLSNGELIQRDSYLQTFFFYIRVVTLLLPLLIYTKYKNEHLNLTLIAGSCGVILAGYEIWFLLTKFIF